MAREGEDGGELCARGEREVISWLMPDLPFLEKSVSDLRAQVGVGPGEVEAVRGVALGSEFCGGIRKLVRVYISSFLPAVPSCSSPHPHARSRTPGP